MRETEAQDLERFVSNETTVEYDGHVAAVPGLEYLADERGIQVAADEKAAPEPAPHAHDPTGRVSLSRDMIGNLAEMDRLALDEPDDHPHPDGQAFEVER